MIIQCPNCGFSGHIPGYAVESPHNARCLRCGYRFELAPLRGEANARDALVRREGLALSPRESKLAVSAGDPGSSSYELRAMTEDLGEPWHWQPPETDYPGENAGITPAMTCAARADLEAKRRSAEVEESRPGLSGEGHEPAHPHAFHQPAEPWYSRLLDAWAIFFLVWALLIAGHACWRMLVKVDGPWASSEVLAPVFCVLLLVPGAAGLFLLGELARYLRGLRGPLGDGELPPDHRREVHESPKQRITRLWGGRPAWDWGLKKARAVTARLGL